MLVTLLVIWVIVIPVLTVIGTYVASGILRRRAASSAVSAAPLGRVAERIEPGSAGTQRTRIHRPSRRTRGHALAGR